MRKLGRARPLVATLLAVSGLVFAGCPDSKTGTPATLPPPGNTAPPKVTTPPPPPPAAPPKDGWGAVGLGSSFETVTKTHFENGIPDLEKTTVETLKGFELDGALVEVVDKGGGVSDPTQPPTKYPFKAFAKDPNAKTPEAAKETVTVAGKSYDCEVTTETADGVTTKTWRTRALPVAVKVEAKGEGYTSTATLVRVEVK